MRLIVVRRGAGQRVLLSAGRRGSRGLDGRGVTSVAIDAQKHLIVTFDDGATQDAGVLPSSDDLLALQQTVTAQQQTIADLLARIAVLEEYHAVPTNALADASGIPLVDASGAYLTLGAVA